MTAATELLDLLEPNHQIIWTLYSSIIGIVGVNLFPYNYIGNFTFMQEKNNSNRIKRIAVSTMFFMAGICFASWGSRISNIQQKFALSDQTLGAVLFALPIGLVLSLPLSGWLVNKVGSRILLAISLSFFGIILIVLGMVQEVYQLVICLVLFGLFCNATNISVNTQAAATEKLYGRSIMSSFHGIYSIATFMGAGIGTLMIGLNIDAAVHFIIIGLVTIINVMVCLRYFNNDPGVKDQGKTFVLPEKSLFMLGMIAFCSMVIDGAMFDWGVIYFRKIVNAEKGWITAGYTACMFTMAVGRFFADRFSNKFGLRKTLQISGVLSTSGLLTAVVFPTLIPSIIGFLLIGAGISSVVPIIYSAASKSKKMSSGAAIAAVSTISFIGFLFGPPLIGYIAGLFSLRVSFIFLIVMGLGVITLSTKAKIQ